MTQIKYLVQSLAHSRCSINMSANDDQVRD